MDARALGGLLRRRREAMGFSQQAVADAAGIRWNVEVSLAERGKSTPASARRVRVGVARLERQAGPGYRLAWPYTGPAVLNPGPKAPKPTEQDVSRRIAAAVPISGEYNALQVCMVSRAWDLLDQLKTEEADAIMEFLPEPVVLAILDQFFDSQDERPTKALHILFSGKTMS